MGVVAAECVEIILYIVTAHNCHISVKGSKTAGTGWNRITRAACEVSQQTCAPSPRLTWVIVILLSC